MIDRGAKSEFNPAAGNLLVAGLYSPGSGLTNVVSAIMRELRRWFAIQGIGFEPSIETAVKDVILAGCPIHVQTSAMRMFLADPDWLRNYMQTSVPKAVLIIGPALMAHPMLRQMQKYRDRCKLFLYLPVEGEIVNEEICQTLDLVDGCILYTEHARRNVDSLCRQAVRNGLEFRIPRFYAAGHGVDTSDFFPVGGKAGECFAENGRSAARRSLFPGRPELHNSFLVLNANRNYLRKRLDLSIAGFARFAAGHRDAYLYLHTGRMAKQQLIELQKLIDDTGLGERILLNSLDPELSGFPVEKLNLLYNACEVGLTTAMGEGWGLTNFEHAATGAAQIVPDHTSFRENWRGAAEMLPVTGREHIFFELADMFTVEADAVAGALERLYSDRRYCKQMAAAAYERSTEPRFTWQSIGGNFKDILDNEIVRPQLSPRLTRPDDSIYLLPS